MQRVLQKLHLVAKALQAKGTTLKDECKKHKTEPRAAERDQRMNVSLWEISVLKKEHTEFKVASAQIPTSEFRGK